MSATQIELELSNRLPHIYIPGTVPTDAIEAVKRKYRGSHVKSSFQIAEN